MKYSHRPTHSPTPAKTTRPYPAVVLVEQEPGLGAPLGALTTLLAQTLATDFGDAVVIVHVFEGGGEDLPEGIELDAHRVDHLSLALPAGDDAVEALHARARMLCGSYAYVFLDLSGCRPSLSREATLRLAATDLGPVGRRYVYLTKSRAVPDLPAAWSLLRTDVLAPLAHEPVAPDPPSLHGIRGAVTETTMLLREVKARLGGAAIEPQGEPYPEGRVVPEWCRVRLDIPWLSARPDVDLNGLHAPAKTSFSHWGRALTFRRVGVALGGSGSWGYAHVALMGALRDRGVPIDLVGGTSSGALMGAYYCVLGRDGLELAIERGARFERMATLSFITSTLIDVLVDADLGSASLEDLEVAFFPSATNLTRGRAEVITRSTIGSAVRASGSAPGVFAATITRSGLYVDGAITDNVPVVLVERMGADLCIACNPLPPPLNVEVRPPTTPLADFLAEFNLVNRLRDIYVSFALMLHDYGDCEPADNRVVYDPTAQAATLFRTSEFGKARQIVESVERDPAFQETIRKAMEAWQRLARPRSPQAMSDPAASWGGRRFAGMGPRY